MTPRTATFVLLGFVALSQLLVTHQRTRHESQRTAQSRAVTDLARVAHAVQSWTSGTQQAGGGVALADVRLEDLGLNASPCLTATPSTDAVCFDSPDLHIELRQDSASGVEIVAAGHDAAVLARAHVRGTDRDDVEIEVVR